MFHAHNAVIGVLNAVGDLIDVKISKVLSMHNGGALNLTAPSLGSVYDHFGF
jgi:hypothetical protein